MLQKSKNSSIDLSIIIGTYKMKRELPRTIFTCKAPFQKLIENKSIEIVIANNDSLNPLSNSDLNQPVDKIINANFVSKSPVRIINQAVAESSGRNLLIIMDGARMISPNLISNTLEVLKNDKRAIVTPLALHLGPKHQTQSVLEGYNKSVEDELLSSVDWQDNGNLLFTISSLAGSNPNGFYGEFTESCAIGMSRFIWGKINGFEEEFISPGGGFATLDLFKRAVEYKRNKLYVLLDGGSFHQIHKDLINNKDVSDDKSWHNEYELIRNVKYTKPNLSPIYFGTEIPEASNFYLR